MSSDEDPQFAQVDWDAVERSGGTNTALRAVLVVLGALLVFWVSDLSVDASIVDPWRRTDVAVVRLVGVVLIVAFLGLPAIRDRETTRELLASLRARPHHAAAASYLVVLFLVGGLGPMVVGELELTFRHSYHPPVGFTSKLRYTTDCLGPITSGEGITQYCHGSLDYPLGTNRRGHSMVKLLALGARTALSVIVFTVAFVVPLATAVGLAAGLRGGLVDDLLMGYVDLQLSLPAMLVYFVGYAYWNPSLLLLLAAFGLFSWGGIARLVRSEVLQRREAGHVRVARSLGASDRYIARRHLLPNVTNTVVPSVFQLLALLLVVEVGVAFLGFQDLGLRSWGSTMAQGLNPAVTAGNGLQASYPAHEIWWVATLPAIALTLTIWSLKLLGDGLRDALDPRRGEP